MVLDLNPFNIAIKSGSHLTCCSLHYILLDYDGYNENLNDLSKYIDIIDDSNSSNTNANNPFAVDRLNRKLKDLDLMKEHVLILVILISVLLLDIIDMYSRCHLMNLDNV